jgi:hypothetical protein
LSVARRHEYGTAVPVVIRLIDQDKPLFGPQGREPLVCGGICLQYVADSVHQEDRPCRAIGSDGWLRTYLDGIALALATWATKQLEGLGIFWEVQLIEIAAIVGPSGIHDSLGKERKQPPWLIGPVQVRKAEQGSKAVDAQRIAHIAEPVARFVVLKDADGFDGARLRVLPSYGETLEDTRGGIEDLGVLDQDVTPPPRHSGASLGWS